jgi:hypothetical protein
MGRTSSKDIFDLRDERLDQLRLLENLRLDRDKRRSFLALNGLGSPFQQRKKEKEELLKALKASGEWGRL